MNDLIITAGSDEAKKKKEIEFLIESAIREGVIGDNTEVLFFILKNSRDKQRYNEKQ